MTMKYARKMPTYFPFGMRIKRIILKFPTPTQFMNIINHFKTDIKTNTLLKNEMRANCRKKSLNALWSVY